MSHTISAELRTDFGKGMARKIRKAGKVPAVIYANGEEATHITVDPIELLNVFRVTKNANTVVEINVDGKTISTLVKKASRHPVSRDLEHVDFLSVSDEKPVVVYVPVTTVGRPEGAILGGRLRIIRRTLKTRAVASKIPENFVVDISPMNIGDMVKASEVPLPEGVELVFDNDFNVLTVYGKRGGVKK